MELLQHASRMTPWIAQDNLTTRQHIHQFISLSKQLMPAITVQRTRHTFTRLDFTHIQRMEQGRAMNRSHCTETPLRRFTTTPPQWPRSFTPKLTTPSFVGLYHPECQVTNVPSTKPQQIQATLNPWAILSYKFREICSLLLALFTCS